MEVYIETFATTLPIIGALLISVGIMKQYLYYKYFKIRILSFLSIDEVLISFADNLIFYALVLLVYGIFTAIIFANNNEVNTKAINLLGLSWPERMRCYLSQNWTIIIVISVLGIAIIIFGKLRKNVTRFEVAMNLCLLLFVGFIFPVLLFEARILYIPGVLPSYLILFGAVFILIGYSISIAYTEVYKVSKGYFKGTKFQTKGKLIKSTHDYYYIGQSKRFIFFYDANKSESEIIPLDSITSFKFNR